MDSQAAFVGLVGPRRKALRLSIQQAAQQAGVHRLTWSAWEKGKAQPEEYNYAGIDTALQLQSGTIADVAAGRPFNVAGPKPPPRTRQEQARSVVLNATRDDLVRMANAYAEVFGEAEGEAFLLRAAEIRAEAAEERGLG